MMGTSEEGKNTEMVAPNLQKYTKAAQIFLRLMAMAAALAAAWIVLSSNETVVIYGITAHVKYSYSPTYKFFAAVNLIACVLSATSVFLFYIIGKSSKSINYFLFFLHDLVVMTLLMAGCSAATAMGYLGRYGNKHAGWIAICGYLESYCNRITISVTLSYIAFLFYFFLAIISASKARPSTTQVIKFFAAVNLIACVLSAISVFLFYIIGKTSKSINYFLFFLHDLVVMTLLMAGCSAATAMGYLGRYGNKHAGWIAICGYLESYCNRITISVTLSYIAFLFYFFLAIISASKARPSTTQVIK